MANLSSPLIAAITIAALIPFLVIVGIGTHMLMHKDNKSCGRHKHDRKLQKSTSDTEDVNNYSNTSKSYGSLDTTTPTKTTPTKTTPTKTTPTMYQSTSSTDNSQSPSDYSSSYSNKKIKKPKTPEYQTSTPMGSQPKEKPQTNKKLEPSTSDYNYTTKDAEKYSSSVKSDPTVNNDSFKHSPETRTPPINPLLLMNSPTNAQFNEHSRTPQFQPIYFNSDTNTTEQCSSFTLLNPIQNFNMPLIKLHDQCVTVKGLADLCIQRIETAQEHLPKDTSVNYFKYMISTCFGFATEKLEYLKEKYDTNAGHQAIFHYMQLTYILIDFFNWIENSEHKTTVINFIEDIDIATLKMNLVLDLDDVFALFKNMVITASNNFVVSTTYLKKMLMPKDDHVAQTELENRRLKILDKTKMTVERNNNVMLMLRAVISAYQFKDNDKKQQFIDIDQFTFNEQDYKNNIIDLEEFKDVFAELSKIGMENSSDNHPLANAYSKIPFEHDRYKETMIIVMDYELTIRRTLDELEIEAKYEQFARALFNKTSHINESIQRLDKLNGQDINPNKSILICQNEMNSDIKAVIKDMEKLLQKMIEFDKSRNIPISLAANSIKTTMDLFYSDKNMKSADLLLLQRGNQLVLDEESNYIVKRLKETFEQVKSIAYSINIFEAKSISLDPIYHKLDSFVSILLRSVDKSSKRIVCGDLPDQKDDLQQKLVSILEEIHQIDYEEIKTEINEFASNKIRARDKAFLKNEAELDATFAQSLDRFGELHKGIMVLIDQIPYDLTMKMMRKPDAALMDNISIIIEMHEYIESPQNQGFENFDKTHAMFEKCLNAMTSILLHFYSKLDTDRVMQQFFLLLETRKVAVYATRITQDRIKLPTWDFSVLAQDIEEEHCKITPVIHKTILTNVESLIKYVSDRDKLSDTDVYGRLHYSKFLFSSFIATQKIFNKLYGTNITQQNANHKRDYTMIDYHRALEDFKNLFANILPIDYKNLNIYLNKLENFRDHTVVHLLNPLEKQKQNMGIITDEYRLWNTIFGLTNYFCDFLSQILTSCSETALKTDPNIADFIKKLSL